jgi:hypothetical protein
MSSKDQTTEKGTGKAYDDLLTKRDVNFHNQTEKLGVGLVQFPKCK